MDISENPPILNLSVTGPPSPPGETGPTFALFPRLPPELRLDIWEHSLRKQRLIEVDLYEYSYSDSGPRDSVGPQDSAGPRDSKCEATEGGQTRRPRALVPTNHPGRRLSGRAYTVTTPGVHLHSKLFRVNRESQDAALRFYRVHFPCDMWGPDSDLDPEWNQNSALSILYLNPEYDVLHISGCGSEHTIADFFHDLGASDPQNVGLLNLALDSAGMTMLSCLKKHHLSSTLTRAAMVDTLAQLQQIIWVAHSDARRTIMGAVTGFPGAGEFPVDLNRAMPVASARPAFQLLPRDPRPLDPSELRYVCTGGSDPRTMRVKWQELLARWQVYHARPVQERVLFASRPNKTEPVYNVATAKRFVREEEKAWARHLYRTGKHMRAWVARSGTENSPKEELPKNTETAIGFWLFPAEALGSLEDDMEETKKTFNLRGYWPELALSELY